MQSINSVGNMYKKFPFDYYLEFTSGKFTSFLVTCITFFGGRALRGYSQNCTYRNYFSAS